VDYETAVECYIEIAKLAPHWLDAITILLDEVEGSRDLSPSDRTALCAMLKSLEHVPSPESSQALKSIWELLAKLPGFQLQWGRTMAHVVTGQREF
jgi:hypothetical protein